MFFVSIYFVVFIFMMMMLYKHHKMQVMLVKYISHMMGCKVNKSVVTYCHFVLVSALIHVCQIVN